MRPTTSRRLFLKLTGTGVALTAFGGTALATHTPTVDFYEINGPNRMTDRVLIAYASRCGSTGEIAEVIAKELTARGRWVDVRLVEHVVSVYGYQAVIVGSSVHLGEWLPEARGFVKKHRQALAQLPNAFFTVHMLNIGDDVVSQTNRTAYLDSIRKIVTPQEEVYFAGKVEFARMSFVDRMIAKSMMATDNDTRNWTQIREWGKSVFADMIDADYS